MQDASSLIINVQTVQEFGLSEEMRSTNEQHLAAWKRIGECEITATASGPGTHRASRESGVLGGVFYYHTQRWSDSGISLDPYVNNLYVNLDDAFFYRAVDESANSTNREEISACPYANDPYSNLNDEFANTCDPGKPTPGVKAFDARGPNGSCGKEKCDRKGQEESSCPPASPANRRSSSWKRHFCKVYKWTRRVWGQILYDDDFADVDYFIPLPGASDDPKVPVEDGFIQLSCEDTERIFEPVVQDVEELIAKQILCIIHVGLSAKTIILVGGFGSSVYLLRHLQKKNPRVTVLQPPNAWSAVVSGAVHRGLEGNRVESRVARRNYGVECRSTFDPSLHNPDDKVWGELQEKYFVDDRVRWYITKSSKIYEDKPIKMGFYHTVQAIHAHELHFLEDLQFCNDENAPNAMNSKVMRLCSLEADLSKVPRKLFEQKTNSQGVQYFKIPFKLVMTPTSASLLFELEFNGVSYGSVRTKY
ncbi:hypothetical protein FE257_004342 [Aspergillus nanangensis]|uniref:Uncharacterized protein n=1 Tax=Aspergillus nanangensis TaxID=2582783 RepID=A0AAD4GN19_ASPNN|nr:hypothetical protein FE257_004342 [Aspergillus nanangensis]